MFFVIKQEGYPYILIEADSLEEAVKINNESWWPLHHSYSIDRIYNSSLKDRP